MPLVTRVLTDDFDLPGPSFTVETPGSTSQMTSPYPSPANEVPSSFSAATPHFDLAYPPSELQSTPLAQSSGSSGSPTSSHNPDTNKSVVSIQARYPGTELIQQNETSPTFPPSRSPVLDDRIQIALRQYNAADLQQLFTALVNQQGLPTDQMDLDSLQQGLQQQQNQLPPSPPSSQSLAPFNFLLSPQLPSQSSPGLSDVNGLISFDGVPYLEQWKQASDIEQEVDHIATGIDSLIQDLGIDPVVIANAETNQANGGELDTSMLNTTSLPAISDSVSNDDLFNSFFNPFPSPGSALDSNTTGMGGGTAMDVGSTNPVSSFKGLPPPAAPPTIAAKPASAESIKTTGGPGVNTRAQKRKSDAGGEVIKTPSNPKIKKRKDK
ncbi:hypothetical protein F5890DRAFT_1136345 [Lentinula detonsa]|uniref:Uncharacterized protein n=1 Tax=Lentinula detonsa TaxID=2804962 RepID=A0AA38UWP5_9AGAR|nr:hypothetical protein F5890DRAFT_1136345 [Lentinula detonsa]